MTSATQRPTAHTLSCHLGTVGAADGHAQGITEWGRRSGPKSLLLCLTLTRIQDLGQMTSWDLSLLVCKTVHSVVSDDALYMVFCKLHI